MTISSASSHQKSRSKPPIPSVVTQEATKATVIAIEISSIMPGRRAASSERPPVRNGQPPYRNITVPRTGEIQPAPVKSGTWYPSVWANISLNSTTGSASTRLIQKRSRNWAAWSVWWAWSAWPCRASPACPDCPRPAGKARSGSGVPARRPSGAVVPWLSMSPLSVGPTCRHLKDTRRGYIPYDEPRRAGAVTAGCERGGRRDHGEAAGGRAQVRRARHHGPARALRRARRDGGHRGRGARVRGHAARALLRHRGPAARRVPRHAAPTRRRRRRRLDAQAARGSGRPPGDHRAARAPAQAAARACRPRTRLLRRGAPRTRRRHPDPTCVSAPRRRRRRAARDRHPGPGAGHTRRRDAADDQLARARGRAGRGDRALLERVSEHLLARGAIVSAAPSKMSQALGARVVPAAALRPVDRIRRRTPVLAVASAYLDRQVLTLATTDPLVRMGGPTRCTRCGSPRAGCAARSRRTTRSWTVRSPTRCARSCSGSAASWERPATPRSCTAACSSSWPTCRTRWSVRATRLGSRRSSTRATAPPTRTRSGRSTARGTPRCAWPSNGSASSPRCSPARPSRRATCSPTCSTGAGDGYAGWPPGRRRDRAPGPRGGAARGPQGGQAGPVRR